VEHPLVVDVDATLVTAHSDKENAKPTFKKGYGFHPLCVFVDHGSEGTGEPLAILLRPGNESQGSHRTIGGVSDFRWRLWGTGGTGRGREGRGLGPPGRYPALPARRASRKSRRSQGQSVWIASTPRSKRGP